MWPVFVSLVVLCWTGVVQSSSDCPWNQFHLGRINNKIILLLENMGGYLPVQCMEKQTLHFFPENIFTDAEEDSIPLLVLQTGQLFINVFGGNMSSLSWNTEKVQLLRNHVFRQTTQLQQCVNQDGVTDTVTTVPALASFSDQLTALHTQEECSWELIRSEFQYAFKQLKAYLDKRGRPHSK
ncbi:interferon alpha-like [Gadus macrocephalus]|uniref:interferon alpha-like n=1 Tax=Gadus macrocephalus TaxID=80720 RepID=UPI0028CB8C71|nr:interferon alpha-like [Gadus macrocephalus]